MKVIITENRILSVAKKELTKKFGDLRPYETDKWPGYIYYIDDNKNIYFECYKKNGKVWVNDNSVWTFLEDVFQLDFNQIQQLIKEWLEEHYKLSVRQINRGIHSY
jgi:hypothetical protein